ncbi:M20 family metallopeptidase [Paenibacillus sp. OSY-SE]|uniref:M20 family metallopeptidase n=1 Tax=Paenibacillus sp. OSY-SE TaxID=1196323 RepID=UPI000303645F|nr:ArgE/DapE family deacylase [Paenibacillus sp. OSY-SE]
MNEWKQRWIDEVEQRRDELLELCSRLIQFPTENPPGDSREISQFIIDYLAEVGIDTEVHDAGGNMLNLIATIGDEAASDRHLIYCGHTDVVPAGDRSRWDFDPFCGEVRDGYVLGRGASDMKCGLAGLIFSVKLLKDLQVPLQGRLSLLIVPDEETGGHLGVPWVFERELIHGTAAVIAEPSHPLHPTIGQKGSCWFNFTVPGTPGHGSLSPLLGDNAIMKAAAAVQALQQLHHYPVDLPDEVKDIIEVTKQYIAQKENADFSAIIDRVSVNVGLIEGGTKTNVVPDRCTVSVDTRLPFGVEPSQVLAEATRLLAGIGIETDLHPEGFQGLANWTPSTDPIVEELVQHICDVKQEEAYGVLQWASSDARHFRRVGIPVLQYGPAELSTIHGFNEKAPVQDVVDAAKVYTLTALSYLGGE